MSLATNTVSVLSGIDGHVSFTLEHIGPLDPAAWTTMPFGQLLVPRDSWPLPIAAQVLFLKKQKLSYLGVQQINALGIFSISSQRILKINVFKDQDFKINIYCVIKDILELFLSLCI